MSTRNYSQLKIILLAFATTALVVISGFRTEVPSPIDAINYTAVEARNQILIQCGEFVANQVQLVGSVRTQTEKEMVVLQNAYINDEIIGEFGFFVFSSFKFYNFVVPMIDLVGASVVNCAHAGKLN